MKRMLGAILALLLGDPTLQAQDRKLGTSLEWEKSIDDAAKQAIKEGKLVLALHLSGHFDQFEFS